MIRLGSYRLISSQKKEHRRTPRRFSNTEGDLHQWVDRKTSLCQLDEGTGECGATFDLLSNRHLAEEVERLRNHSGVLDGPLCPACGARYRAAPGELVFNGIHG